MNTKRFLFLIMLTTLLGISVRAQQKNVLQVPDVLTQAGKDTQLSIVVENTDKIVGVQFDFKLPDDIRVDTNGKLGNRCQGYSVTIQKVKTGAYRVLMLSTQNEPIKGESGEILSIPITIPAAYKEGTSYDISLSNVVLSKSTGENVLTEATTGKIHILTKPDLTIKNIEYEQKAVNPGDTITASWRVDNIGELPTEGGWREQISLIGENGAQSILKISPRYDSILNGGDSVVRQIEIILPTILGIDGDVNMQINIIPDWQEAELGNNSGRSSNTIHINKVLYIEGIPERIIENEPGTISMKISRSGFTEKAETFSIGVSQDRRISVSASTTIPVGNATSQKVYINIKDNEILDNDSVVRISITGNGYPETTKTFIIEDDEYPDLILTASKTVVTEGKDFKLTVATSRASENPIEVTLSSEDTERFIFPKTVVIPADTTSTTVTVKTIDDEQTDMDLQNVFKATAFKHNDAEIIVTLQDDDMPKLSMELTPDKVKEKVGEDAVTGVLHRITKLDSKIMVRLTDDSEGGLNFVDTLLVLDKGIKEVPFKMGPVNNDLIEGDRTYTVTATVWFPSCDCTTANDSIGTAQARLTVYDEDGLELGINATTDAANEGDDITLIITRNNTSELPAVVTLKSDDEDNMTYEHTVTIKAGESEAAVEVKLNNNNVLGDDRAIMFTAESEDYASDTCYVDVIDQTVEPTLECITGLPEEGNVLKEPLREVTVKFNKPIKPESFTTEKIALTHQNGQKDVSNIQITQESDTEFKIDFKDATELEGRYVLTLQTSAIEDVEGLFCSKDVQVDWVWFEEGKPTITITCNPTKGGTVTPESNRFDYDSDVTLTATANEGYDFTGWTLNGKVVSTSNPYVHHVTDNAEVKALFNIKHKALSITYDDSRGGVSGAQSGTYDYGTPLRLSAYPKNGYSFESWIINGEISYENPIVIYMKQDMNISAIFQESITTGIQNAEDDVLHISITPQPLRDNIQITGNFQIIRRVDIYDLSGTKAFGTSDIQVNSPINIGNLKSGIYIIRIETDRGIYRAKVLKQ